MTSQSQKRPSSSSSRGGSSWSQQAPVVVEAKRQLTVPELMASKRARVSAPVTVEAPVTTAAAADVAQQQDSRKRHGREAAPWPAAASSTAKAKRRSPASYGYGYGIRRVNTVRLDDPSLATHVVAIDCEFVGTGPRGSVSALGRASVLPPSIQILLDVMCRPDEPITDYRTRWSGIRPADMERGLPFDTVQDMVRRAVRGRILIGHALHNDLGVLRLQHPEGLVRDTSRSLLLQTCADMPPQGKRPASLRSLALALLGRRIQCGEHDSVEDADACLQLYRLVAAEWEAELAVRLPPAAEAAAPDPAGNADVGKGAAAAAAPAAAVTVAAKRREDRLHQLSYANPQSAARLTSRRQLRPGFVGTWQAGESDGLLEDDKYW